jgi:hypothetical protein
VKEFTLRTLDGNKADYNTMLKLREGYLVREKITDARLLLAVGKAWTWGWVNGLDYFDTEKDDGDMGEQQHDS